VSTTTKPLGIGIVGCGLMGSIHAECFTATPGMAPVAYLNPTRSKAEALAARHGGTVYDTLPALLADPAVEAVAVCSPQAHHHAQVMAAIAAGKHIFCEKPVALTLAELRDIKAAVAKAGVAFVTGHQMRLHPVIQAVRQAMPQLGAIYHLDMEWCFRIAGHTGRCFENYRLGGFFMELGCHAADLACHFLGRPVHVNGYTLRIDPKRVTEDYTNCLLQFDSGAVANILVSANHRTKRQGLLIGRVLGEKGRIDFTVYPYQRANNGASLVLDGGKKVFVPDETKTVLPIPELPSRTKVYPGFYDIYYRQAEAFLRTVRDGAPPVCSLADGAYAVEIVLATYHQQAEASARRNLVTPPPEYISDATAHPLLKTIAPAAP
jgi:predicted dehydrogenase